MKQGGATLSTTYQSEIRDSVVRDLLEKVKRQSYGKYLRRIRLTKVRAFDGETVDFDYPVTALIGTNGGWEINDPRRRCHRTQIDQARAVLSKKLYG